MHGSLGEGLLTENAVIPIPCFPFLHDFLSLPHYITARGHAKRRCEITIISFSRSIFRGGLATLIGVTGKPYLSCLSYHSHLIRPCEAPSPRGEGCDTRIPSSKKRRRSRHLNLEPNESIVKRGCEEMRIHSFTAPSVFISSYDSHTDHRRQHFHHSDSVSPDDGLHSRRR